MANEEFVDDTVESVAVESTKFLKEEAFKFTKLTDAEILMNHITDMKHNDLIMDCCIKEAMILAEGVDVENRLAALHEGAWDKVKEFFNKIKTFVMNLFTKVENWFDKFFKSNKDYIEKYKDQINKPTAGFTTVNMANYKDGLVRIQTPKVPNFNAVISDNVMNAGEDNAALEKVIDDFRKTLVDDYKPGDEWKEACNNFFKGGKDSERDYSTNEINIVDLSNKVLEIPKIVDGIKKDKATSDQLYKSLEAAINRLANATPKTESVYLYNENVFTEDTGAVINNTGSTAPGTTAAQSANSADIAKAGNDTIKTVNDKANADKPDNKAGVQAQKVINKMASTMSTYYQCKYQMAEKIMSDYMKIIKAHVSAYVNANNNTEKAQQSN